MGRRFATTNTRPMSTKEKTNALVKATLARPSATPQMMAQIDSPIVYLPVRSTVISLVGGATGIAVGYIVADLLKTYQQMPTLIPVTAVIQAVAFSAGVGIFFGFYPARKAAGLDPIEALRFE